MTRKVDEQVLLGFIEEAKGYLPSILQGIETFRTEPSQTSVLEEAHRHIHTIKGASSMVGLTALSHVAFDLEQIFADIVDGYMVVIDEDFSLFREAISQIELYLDGVLSESFCEEPVISEVNYICRRLRGLPEEDDREVEEGTKDLRIAETPSTVEDDSKESLSRTIGVSHYEEISPELLEVFTIEAEDHLRFISTQLGILEKEPENKEKLQDIRRTVHTLKGAAGAVGLGVVARLAHRMEDLLDQVYEGDLAVDGNILELLYASTDALEDLSFGVGGEEELQSILQDLYAEYDGLVTPSPEEERWSGRVTPLIEEAMIDLSGFMPPIPGDGKPMATDTTEPSRVRKPGEVMRVPLDRLDDLVRMVSELVINRTAFEQRMGDFVREVDELQLSSERLRRVSSNLETKYEVSALGGRLAVYGAMADTDTFRQFDPVSPHGFDDLEFDRYTEFHLLSRELIETTSDIRTVGHELATLIGEFDGILNRQGRLSSEIQDKLMRTRMVTMATLATRLHRTVRVIAREQGKLVDLVLEGEEIELDKSVLDNISDPLLHLMRNAADHGIEPPALRQVIGKPERGLIRLEAYHEGNQVVIRVSDDGAGMELQALRSAAVRGGFVSETEASQLSDEDLYSKVFLPGFTTAAEVSEVSGRGVGLDIVKTNVQKLKGSIRLESHYGEGTVFTIRLPMTLAVMRALLVRAHNETFAIPLGVVTNILRLQRGEIERIGEDPVVRMDDKVYPLIWLGDVLDLKQPADETLTRIPVLILDFGDQQIGLAVDHLIGGREIVIKTLGTHLRRVHGIAGTTLMGDGGVVLILNPSELVQEPPKPATRDNLAAQVIAANAREAYTVMIVDDSLSVRRVVSNLIKSAGWLPIIAKDGLEALEIMQQSDQLPDLILVDIEMPRMDGYELMSAMKADATYQDIPLVVLTSRAGDKHRQKAMAVGASDYIVKPYQDDVMLKTIRHRVQESKRTVLA
jgi:chemosensory pili system protein ChpA (sensor histidine kinase/response regulator)